MDIVKKIVEVSEAGIDLFFPRRCPVCDQVLPYRNGLICRPCSGRIKYIKEPACMKCGKQLSAVEEEYCYDCGRRSHQYIKGAALYDYSCMKESIYRFKYQGRKEYARFYAAEIKKVLGSRIRSWKPEALVPVPIHYLRKNRRGYNQSQVLAEMVSEEIQVPVRDNLIIRCKKTLPQKELDAAGRQNNLKKAFKICRNDVELNTIVIIDDIYTTGNTIDTMAAELKKIGVQNIYFVALAIGHGL